MVSKPLPKQTGLPFVSQELQKDAKSEAYRQQLAQLPTENFDSFASSFEAIEGGMRPIAGST